MGSVIKKIKVVQSMTLARAMLAQGFSDAQIVEHLVISVRTVNRHVTSLYSKLGVSSRAAATLIALEQHML